MARAAFRELDSYVAIGDSLLETLAASEYPRREEALLQALQAAASLHNTLGATRRVDETVGLFHERPFRVLGSGRFVDACLERIADPRLPALPLVGSIDQLMDSSDVLGEPHVRAVAERVYDLWLD